MTLRHFPILAATTFLALAGCATTTPRGNATVQLTPAAGSQVTGTLTAMPMGNGAHLTGNIAGLAPGSTHAFHIHEKGDCSAADASSAGGHFNPTGQPHGNVQGSGAHHLGDQTNLQADAGGSARVNAHFAGVTLGDGGANDVMGKAIVVHADADDYTSRPAGNAGGRIACGVIR